MEGEIDIRPLFSAELPILDDMVYESIFLPEAVGPLPREIIYMPDIHIYIRDFGQMKDDYCLVAVLGGKVVGAVLARILAGEPKGYGHVDSETPELAIALYEEYRNRGFGSLLMKQMIATLKSKGYNRVSLSVNKANHALKLYRKLGFEPVVENKEDYIMLLRLK